MIYGIKSFREMDHETPDIIIFFELGNNTVYTINKCSVSASSWFVGMLVFQIERSWLSNSD
jgi:hypothetical protein